MNIKKIFLTAAAAVLSVSLLAGCEGTPDNGSADGITNNVSGTSDPLAEADIHNFIMPEQGEKIAVITVKDMGEIKIKLFPEDAPKGVENFIGLADMGYYDELIFHRVIPNFMNQGGDPRGDGTGGKSIWGEKFEGGTSEHLYHFTGAVAYANSGSTSTNGSQFYIVNTPDDFVYYGAYRDADGSIQYLQSFEESGISLPGNVKDMYLQKGGVPFLDGGYTVFGQVFEGMDVVRKIAEVETDDNDKPLTQVVMESVKIEEYQG
ncbi:MAG: peptidylprolyl isomerase [Eubacterium sp.]|nr:peptidylprolyl isomerase [Eubacterium sp.]